MTTAQSMLLSQWRAELTRGRRDTPRVSPLFVAEQGPAVQIVDLRAPEEATGVVGYIPGSWFPGIERLRGRERRPDLPPLVLVCPTGELSSELARELELSGVERVAAMEGGLAAWRHQGFVTSRDADGIHRSLPDYRETVAGDAPWTVESVAEHIGDRRSVRWMKVSSMMAHGRLSCIDGRDERGVIGSPGGDGGMFLLTLAAIERVTGETADETSIFRALVERLDRFGNFYLHSDAQAFNLLIDALRSDPRLGSTMEGIERSEEWMDLLHRPPEEIREPLLEHLVAPSHLGCGHIRLLLQHSAEYGIRREAVNFFLRAFFRLWWEGAPEISFTVLPGEHREVAVINVRLATETSGLSRIPLISPASGGRQIFVHHPGVSSYLRRRAVLVLAGERRLAGIDRKMMERLQDAVDELGDRHLQLTVGRLAKGLPVFEVTFAEDGSYEVRESSG